MTDYLKSTGSSGTMMIRDLGSTVEFWLKAGSSTFAYDLPVGWTYNGSTGSGEFRFESGGAWQKVRSFVISTSQTVTFRIGDSGTNGLGGPTSFSVALSRQAKPDPPSAVSLTQVMYTTLTASFSDGDNNGDAIDARQIGYGPSSTTPAVIVSSDRSTGISGLAPATRYYFWARTHNSLGWSAWGPRSTVVMMAGVLVRYQGTWRRAIPYVRSGGVWRVAQAYVKRSGIWKPTV